jgi:hypothetical protein
MDHTHPDAHLHVTTCARCAREYEVRRACDPLQLEEPEPERSGAVIAWIALAAAAWAVAGAIAWRLLR